MIHSVDSTSSRERLLEAARDLFHRQGYNHTSMAEILERASVSSSSLYHFFPSKEALLLAVVDRYFQLLQPHIMGPAGAASSEPVGKILGVLDVYRGFMLDTRFELGCPVGSLALEIGQSCPEARRRIAEIFLAWRGVVEGWLGEAFPGLAAAERSQLSSLLLTLVEGAIVQARVLQDTEPFEVARKQFEGYLHAISNHYREE